MKKGFLLVIAAVVTALLICSLPMAAFAAQDGGVGNEKIADCGFDLITHDSDGNRIVRVHETNLSNLITDAFRSVLEADIAYFNGGEISSDIKAGEITYNDLKSVIPSDSTGVLVEVSGATIVEMLETAVESWPDESGNYPHVSGISFYVNFAEGVTERVYNVKVENPETGESEPIDLEKKYTLASTDAVLIEGADGMDMFADAVVLKNTGVLAVDILKSYITDTLGGVIDEKYAETNYHILFTEGLLIEYPYVTDGDHAIWIALVGVVLMVITIVTVLTIRKKKYPKN